MPFRVTGLSPEPFRHLFGLSAEALSAHGARRRVVDTYPGFPDRISMTDVPVGETVLLVNHVSQDAPTPYHASHAIYVWEGAADVYDAVDAVPEVMRRRLLSLRGFDGDGMMVEADVVEGADAERVIAGFFANPAVSYIHAHNAKPGCFSGRIDRA